MEVFILVHILNIKHDKFFLIFIDRNTTAIIQHITVSKKQVFYDADNQIKDVKLLTGMKGLEWWRYKSKVVMR